MTEDGQEIFSTGLKPHEVKKITERARGFQIKRSPLPLHKFTLFQFKYRKKDK